MAGFSCGSTEHFHITENLFLHTWDNERLFFLCFVNFMSLSLFLGCSPTGELIDEKITLLSKRKSSA